VNSEGKSKRRIILAALAIIAFAYPYQIALAQGSIFGAVSNSDQSTPANGEISFFGFLDDTDEEIRIESSVGAGYDGGNWYDDFQNYLTESAGNQYDYYFHNATNNEGFILSDIIPNNSFEQKDITLTPVDWPTQPDGLTGQSLSMSSIELNWNNLTGMTYHIYRRAVASGDSLGGSFFRIDDPSGSLANPGISGGAFIDTNVTVGVGYHYLIIAQNASGNFSPHSDYIDVTGQEPENPVVTCPGDLIIECSESSEPASTGYASATDNNDPNPIITYFDEITAGSCPNEEIIYRLWTATDFDDNNASCIQTIRIQDNHAPDIACPSDRSINFGESTDISHTGSATSLDNCDNNPTISFADTRTGNIISRVWTSVDACGNSSECEQLIEIIYHAGPDWHVSNEGNDDNDGSIDYPFATIKKAVEISVSGDTVFIADGVYSGDGNRDIDPGGKNIVIMSDSGPEVAVIDCNGTSGDPHRAFYFHTGENRSFKIIGLAIKNGYARKDGGAILCESASPTIFNCHFYSNSAARGGAGIACPLASSPEISDCVFTNNEAIQYGGGIYSAGSSSLPKIAGNIFKNNRAGESGGALFLVNSSPNIDTCSFEGNFAENLGGAICLQNSSTAIMGCSFISNNSNNIGGALYCEQSSPSIDESIFRGNQSVSYGGAIAGEYNSSPAIMSATFVENGAGHGGGLYFYFSSPTIDNSIISFGISGEAVYCRDINSKPIIQCTDIFANAGGDWVGSIASQGGINGNFSSDPFFCDKGLGDFHLAGNSPCLEANSNCGQLIGALGWGCDITDIETEDDRLLPESFSLSQNFPNPFNPSTSIKFTLPAKSNVTITILNILGQEVNRLVDKTMEAGYYEIVWDGRTGDGREVSSGFYFYQLRTLDFSASRKMLLLK